ncbi:LADA_0E06458g1_1 [Lachancea dasiensis]|uniref:LADA_0E06458g1_1 n=1 Tax=Lachancea dasiensis TaxID=1072105 RepID=A0A1G4JCG8_9SACH|nr:LADA_0E06458g1_1 [Lachancea dasiensis]
MNSGPPKSYKFIKKPKELADLFPENGLGNQNIEFVSVLTGIDFDPASRCLLHFKNFDSGDKAEVDYTCRITCSTAQTLTLTKMMLSLFSQHFDFDFPELDEGRQLVVEDVHLEKLCFVDCKGTFVSSGDRGGIFLQGLRPIELSGSLFGAQEKEQKTDIFETTKAIFDNLVRLNYNSKAQFKFVKLLNLSNEMREYSQSRQEAFQLQNERNPIFGASRFHRDTDSLNDFDSQIPDTDPEFSLPAYLNPLLTRHQDNSFGEDPGIDESSSRTNTAVSGLAPKETDVARPIAKNPVSITDPYGHLACTSDKRGKIAVKEELDLPETSDDSLVEDVSIDTQPASRRRFSDTNELLSATKRSRTLEARDDYRGDITNLISNASSDEIIVFEGTIAGARIDPVSPSSCVAVYCQSDKSRLQANQEPLSLNDNCVEVMAYVTDNIKYNSALLEAESSDELLSAIRLYTENKRAKITAKKVPVLLTNGLFTFSLTLRSLQVENYPIVNTSPTLTPRSSQVVMSSCESSQESSDPLKTFSEISVSGARQEFMRTFGLLVSAKKFGQKVTKFVFTDFTTHPLNKLSAFDSFLGSYTHRLPQDMAFPFVIYKDHYSEFVQELKRKTGTSFTEYFNGSDNNLTHHGIVCRLELKVKMYSGSVDGIIRTCEPIISGDQCVRPDEHKFLREFYARCVTNIPQVLLTDNFANYKRFFPFTMFQTLVVLKDQAHQDTSSVLSTPQLSEAPAAVPHKASPKLDFDLENFEVVCDMGLTALPSLRKLNSSVIFEIKAKVAAIFHSTKVLVFVLSDDHASQDMLDPKRLLRIEIPGADNVANFYGSRDARMVSEKTMEKDLVGQILTFRLCAFNIPVSPYQDLRIWCPLECTIQELNAEVTSCSSAVKQETA